MAKRRKIMKLSHGLVLHRYILHLLGCNSLEGIAQHMRDSHLEGYDEENISHYHHALKSRLFANSLLPKELLLDYDQNIYSHTLAISEKRESQIKWRYFQYFTLLFTEIYLDRYFADPQQLLSDLNSFVDRFNNPLDTSVSNEHEFIATSYTIKELSKIAIWSATGSGKTLILHVNVKQYKHYTSKYNKQLELNKVLLITPNEGLSAQHLEEFKLSDINANIFSKSSGGLFSGKAVEIIEISKLGEESGDKTVAVEAFENNNLVLIDEGHRGASGDQWKQRRDALSESGFAFEYSATFGQAISAATGSKKQVLVDEYSKAILFDYSYKYFYQDGYGKDYKILNIKDDSNNEYRRKYLTACLLGFYQQQLVHKDNPSQMDIYQLAKPLWVFVGGSVTKTLSKKEASDVVTIISFISDFVKDSKTSKDHIEQILSNKAGLNDANGVSIFSNTYEYIKDQNQDVEALYSDILSKIFNTGVAGANVYIDNLKGIDGELGLRVGDTPDYFGVINVGDASKLHKLCMEAGVLGMEKDFASSLFRSINNNDSSINLLIGSKKFTEGWSSWRVSTMGLMNIGRGEGSQIIQLFGRGVRLKGHNLSLKRSSRLDDYQRPEQLTPKYVRQLETLNIFGIKADYMQQFKEYLEEEGLPTNEDEFITVTIPTINRYDPNKNNLRVIRTKDGVAENYKKTNIIELKLSEISSELDIKLDWYPKIQMLTSRQTSQVVIVREEGLKLQSHNLAFIDWTKVYFELQKYKNERSWYNLAISLDDIKKIMNNDEWYDIAIPAADLEMTSYEKVFVWQDIVVALLKLYTDKYYRSIKNHFLSRHIEVAPLSVGSANFVEEYTVRIEESQSDMIQEVRRLRKSMLDGGDWPGDLELGNLAFRAIDINQHLYYPLLYMDKSVLRNVAKVTPEALNDGEFQFIEDLRSFYENQPEYLADKQVYLLRNQSRSGIGFLTETKGFYPDFILWQVVGDKQYLSFIDPKGIFMIRDIWNNPKVKFNKTIKEEFQNQLEDKKTFLNSFIVSRSSFRDIQYRGTVDETIQMYHEENIYFQQEDKHTYIEQILRKGLIE